MTEHLKAVENTARHPNVPDDQKKASWHAPEVRMIGARGTAGKETMGAETSSTGPS